jgi:hypothetical protein
MERGVIDSNKIWYWAHFGLTVAIAVIVALSFVLLNVDSDLFFTYSLHGFVILLIVMPGALLVFAINHLILWRRKPRVFRTADKVVIIIVAVLTVVTALSVFSFEAGLVLVFFSVPLLMIAGVISTVIIAVGNTRAAAPALSAVPVEPGTAPVATTLDELFPEPGAPAAPVVDLGSPITEPGTPPVPLTDPGTPPAPGASPYGPKS